nr:MAG TPA: hypothetical protein [Caudoviricetes sp.]
MPPRRIAAANPTSEEHRVHPAVSFTEIAVK